MIHKTARVTVSSPLGLLWQTHRVSKATGASTPREFCNISETLEASETPTDAAVRALSEECSLTISPERFRYRSEHSETKPSPTTGQVKTYRFWDYDLELSQSEAESISLIVDEGDSFIHLKWRKSPPKVDAPAHGGQGNKPKFAARLG